MPSYDNAELLAQKIADCNRELDSLFANLNPGIEIARQTKQIKEFYKRAFDKTSNENTALKIVNQYEEFIITASAVKLGQLTAEQAFLMVDEVTEDRQFNIVMYNIFKVCELFFWTAAAATAYAACLTAGVSLLFLEPLIGFAVMAGTAILFGASIHHVGECFDEFKTFARVNQEGIREKNAISFFSSQPVEKLQEDDVNDLESSNDGIACTH